jgi:hypothetical protein
MELDWTDKAIARYCEWLGIPVVSRSTFCCYYNEALNSAPDNSEEFYIRLDHLLKNPME